MAPRGWFDPAMLLHGERFARSRTARLRVDGPPHWWEGRLILTSERLFFLPDTANDRIGRVAFWLADLLDVRSPGGGRLELRLGEGSATFDLPGAWFRPRSVRGWIDHILRLRGGATARAPLRDPHGAAG